MTRPVRIGAIDALEKLPGWSDLPGGRDAISRTYRFADFNTAFARSWKAKTGQDPSSQYVYPGYVMIDVWAKAVERAKSTDADKVVAELEKMKNEPTLFGPRTFTSELHHQNQAKYLIAETTKGKPHIVGDWTISEAIPLDALMK